MGISASPQVFNRPIIESPTLTELCHKVYRLTDGWQTTCYHISTAWASSKANNGMNQWNVYKLNTSIDVLIELF